MTYAIDTTKKSPEGLLFPFIPCLFPLRPAHNLAGLEYFFRGIESVEVHLSRDDINKPACLITDEFGEDILVIHILEDDYIVRISGRHCFFEMYKSSVLVVECKCHILPDGSDE